MSNVLVVAEQLDGVLRKASLSAVNAGKQLAEKTGGKMHTLVIGSGVVGAATELAAYGGEAVHVADAPELAHALAEPYALVIAQAAQEVGADIVVAAATTTGKDVLPRVAAKLGAGMASDVLSFGQQDSTLVFRRPMWAGSVLADVTIETPKKVLTIRAAEFGHAEKAASPAPVKPLAISLDPTQVHARFIELHQVKSARPDLTDARVIVSGGRGTKGDFKPIEALADSLGAAIGASRAAADAGWVPSDYQVGQTGKTVAPDLYIAVGISGAIQHVAGMKNSKVIVAINKDPDAPIFQIADYGLVGDLFKILPELQAALAKH
jgi:electron transfer flavoprotein alpha subunit